MPDPVAPNAEAEPDDQAVPEARTRSDDEQPPRPPPWVYGTIKLFSTRLVTSLVIGALGALLIVILVQRLRGLISILVISLFLSFAMEPAVNALAARGWKRGLATGLVFLAVAVAMVILFALVIPAVVTGCQQLVQTAPEWLGKIQRAAAKVGIDFSTDRLQHEIQTNAVQIAQHASELVGGVIGLGATILSMIFRWATIGLFTFYIVAEGPRLRRAVCSRLRPERQEEVLFIWNQAIEKTGGYFYSRLLLAVVNGTGMYLVLRLNSIPFAAPLAIFEGVVAEFIPTVGTYIAGAVPLGAALLTSGSAALWVLGYLLVYQQIENYLLSPRLTAKTMQLHPAVAFGAAMVGGAIGGILTAFLALPAAAVIQAAVEQYSARYKVVVQTDLSHEPSSPGPSVRRPRSEGR